MVDVWFESGVTHAFVLEQHPELRWPADLYLEGSDQHRGWFQSSLLASCATRGMAPYKSVLTHGFIVDGEGKKMSKSDGNALTLDEIVSEYGADILKLWVIGSDYSDDLRLSRDHFKRYQDLYRRLRNTLRYILGNLQGHTSLSHCPMMNYRNLSAGFCTVWHALMIWCERKSSPMIFMVFLRCLPIL